MDGTVRSMPEALRLAEVDEHRRFAVLEKLKSGIRVEEALAALESPIHVLLSSESDEWYTPEHFVDAVRHVQGDIHLDPASCTKANETVGAKRFYDRAEDGLNKQWRAKTLFLNPPGGRDGTAGRWVAKLIDEHKAGRVKVAILLCNGRFEATWFDPLWAYPMCFVARPIHFVPADPNRDAGAAKTGQVFVYFGERVQRFVEVFSSIGRIVIPDPKGAWSRVLP